MANESVCCRADDAFWALVESLNPRPPGITCLTQHPGFEACCLNPFVLQLAYMSYSPLQASTHEQYRTTAYRQVVCWAYGAIAMHIGIPIPSCVVSAIRRQFPEEGGVYKGFEWPHLGYKDSGNDFI